jgi:dephospho-CoA kinase
MVLDSAGHVDRRVLAQMVFGANAGSDQRLQYLERILHPLTRQLAIRRMDRWALRGKTAIVLDAPLLLEAHWDLLCDEVWCVRAPFPRRLRWANLRGWSREELVAREAKQINIREKELRSTVLIDNESERVDFLRQIDRLFSRRIQNSSTDIDLP